MCDHFYMIAIYSMEKYTTNALLESPMLRAILIFLLIFFVYVIFISYLLYLNNTWVPFPRIIYYTTGILISWVISFIYLYFHLYPNVEESISGK